jgi:putative inorganic carbon (HCO3(-)) transporter
MRSSSLLSYLTKETGLILFLSYFALIGGGYVGSIVFESRLVTHLLAALVVLVWLGRRVLANDDLPRTSLDLPITAFVAALVLATALSPIPRLSAEGLSWVLSYVLLFYLVIDLLRRGWPADLFLKSLLAVGGVACLLALFEAAQWYLGWLAVAGLTDLVPPTTFRIVRTLGPNPLAAFLNLLIPLAVVAAVGTKRHFNRVLLAGWLVIALLVELLTFSRGGWLGLFTLAATLTIMLSFQYRSQLPARALRKRLGESKPLVSGLVAAMVIASVLICAAGYHLLTIPSRRGSVQERVLMWRSAWMSFIESPVTGTGPWTYGTQFLRYSRTDLRRPVEKAHNIGLTVLAESGLIGLAANLWLFGSVISSLRRRWATATQNQRLLVIGCVASLVGSLAHGIVEDFLTFSFFALTMVVVVAIALGEAQRDEPGLGRRIRCRWLIVPVSLLVFATLWPDVSYFYFSRGARLATEGEWETAAHLLERATDLDPSLPFYHFQLGFVYGHLAHDPESSNLERAIEQYEIGLNQEPYYSLNHANLAALYWQDGKTDLAMEHVRRAMELAPAAPDYALQLGTYYEQLGSDASASRLYAQAIELDRSLTSDLFWEESDLRQQFLASYLHDNSASAPTPPSPGEIAYEEGRYSDAVEYYEGVLSTQPSNKTALTRLGLAYLALGNDEDATRNLQLAIFLGATREPHLALGRRAYDKGDLPQAIAEFEAGLNQPLYSDFYGPGVYRREGIYQSRLPQLPRLGLTPTLVEDYLQLAEMYEEADALDQAEAIYQMLLERLPEFQPTSDELELVQELPANE